MERVISPKVWRKALISQPCPGAPDVEFGAGSHRSRGRGLRRGSEALWLPKAETPQSPSTPPSRPLRTQPKVPPPPSGLPPLEHHGGYRANETWKRTSPTKSAKGCPPPQVQEGPGQVEFRRAKGIRLGLVPVPSESSGHRSKKSDPVR